MPKDEHQAYQRIAKAIRDAKLKTLTIADVKLIRTDDAVLKATRFALKITAVRCGSDVFS